MKKTIQEVEKLKLSWKEDPCWDLSETDGFEDYKEELKIFQEKCEKEWEKQIAEKEAKIDEEARLLGIEGLYRIILRQQQIIDDLKEQIINIKMWEV